MIPSNKDTKTEKELDIDRTIRIIKQFATIQNRTLKGVYGIILWLSMLTIGFIIFYL